MVLKIVRYRVIWLVLLISSLNNVSYSVQVSQTDSVQIVQFIKQGQELLLNSRHEQSIEKYQNAQILANKIKKVKTSIHVENMIIENLWQLNRLEESSNKTYALINKIIEHQPVHDLELELAGAYYNLGTIELKKGLYDTAIYHLNQSIEIRLNSKAKDSKKGLGAAYRTAGLIHRDMGDTEKMLIYAKKALTIDEEVYSNNHVEVAKDWILLGGIYEGQSLAEVAFENYSKALVILQKLGNRSDTFTQVLRDIGQYYMRKGQYLKSLNYQKQSLKNNFDLFGKTHISNAIIYIGLANSFVFQHMDDSSLVYFKKAFAFEKELMRSNKRRLSLLNRGIAFAYVGKDKFDSALYHVKQAISIIRKISPTHIGLNYFHNDLGRVYKAQGSYDEAIENFQISISLFEKSLGTRHTLLTGIYRNISETYQFQNQYVKSLEYIQKSIETNHSNWVYTNPYHNPELSGIVDKKNYFLSLREKQKTLAALYDKEGNDEVLFAQLDTYSIMDRVIRDERRTVSLIEDKIDYQRKYADIYEGAIKANHKAYLLTREPRYLEQCFYYSESDKSSILSGALGTINARNWSQVPAALLELEQEMNSELAGKKSSLNAEIQKKKKDQAQIEAYEKELFELTHSRDSLVSQFEKNFPSYYQVKYEEKTTTINDVQKSLGPKSIFIEYFMGDSMTYAFAVTSDSILFQKIGLSANIAASVNTFRNVIKSAGLNHRSSIDPSMFISSSHELYKLIMAPLEDFMNASMADQMVVIPSGTLNYVPFDLVISKEPTTSQNNFRSLPYLLNDFTIRNAHSASIELNKIKKPTHASNKLLCFAPTYELPKSDYQLAANQNRFRSAITPLEWNKKEISKITNHMSGQSRTGDKATESRFKKDVNNYQILHLAMHAFVDDEDPMNSRLVFSQNADNKDDEDDGFLHTFELFNMQLNAELAVLSACETGYGKLVRGDGIISLAQGFAYAGVPSVVMSHWQVDDHATSELMDKFYEGLSEGQTKSEALHQAKLSFINEGSPNKNHPFFWGAFVVIGDDAAITLNSNWRFYVMGIVTLIVLSIWIVRIRINKSQAQIQL